LHASGGIPDVGWQDIFKFVSPGSGGYNNLARLIDARNPHAVVNNPFASEADVQAGGDLFAERCVTCHGVRGGGGPAPALAGRDFKHGSSAWAVYRTVQMGVPGTGMQPQGLTFAAAWQVVAYVRSLEVAARSEVEQPSVQVDVPYEHVRDLKVAGNDWLTFSGTYSSQRHSALTQIRPDNLARLSVAWIHQFESQPSKLQASPLIRDGVMFTTVPLGGVLAIDARSGKRIWKFTHKHKVNDAGREYVHDNNRGVAIMGKKVFLATGDAQLVALDAASGKLVWTATVEQPGRYYISAAPLAYKDLVVTGVAAWQGGRGLIVAFDAETGKERWRFSAIPDSGKPGNDTWAGESWRNGGASTWMTGSYDVERDILIWGVGNPRPDYDVDVRKGDNLYSNSAVALRGTTGELLWHYQFTPADDKDWDSNQVPILADIGGANGPAPCVLWANRNGFYYVLDRLSGRYLASKAFVFQNWTGPFSESGRPQMLEKSKYKREGQLIFPGNQGATKWWPPTFDPALNLFYVPALEQGMLFYPTAQSWPRDTGKSFHTTVRALNPSTGELVWEHRHPPRLEDTDTGGLLSTASGLLFGSDQSTFFAFDSRTGRVLWSMQTGGKIVSAPVTYSVDGVQYIAVNAGKVLMAFALGGHSGERVSDQLKQ
jgi:alcohol dehydrogenase (cytochrome c)